MKTVLPNYEECITNLSNSILKHFNCDTYHNSIPYIDQVLNNDYKNVIVILCDGMGSILLDELLGKDTFLIKNRKRVITSVFPPTTTSATTSMLSGLNPNEHGWLGWDLYFKKENKVITMFLNTLKDSNIVAENYNVAGTTYPYESITKKINKKYETHELLCFKEVQYQKMEGIVDKIIELSKTNNKKFIYAYYDNPDNFLHIYGIHSSIVKNEFERINNSLEHLCNSIDDSVVIILADHGHIDTKYIFLEDYPNIKNMLERTTSIEPRAVSFKVITEKLEEFKIEFNKYFNEDFILYTKEEILENKIFGVGINNIYFEDAIGDFVAIAISNKSILYSRFNGELKSLHAGLTDREMLIPLIVAEKPKIKVKEQ